MTTWVSEPVSDMGTFGVIGIVQGCSWDDEEVSELLMGPSSGVCHVWGADRVTLLIRNVHFHRWQVGNQRSQCKSHSRNEAETSTPPSGGLLKGGEF